MFLFMRKIHSVQVPPLYFPVIVYAPKAVPMPHLLMCCASRDITRRFQGQCFINKSYVVSGEQLRSVKGTSTLGQEPNKMLGVRLKREVCVWCVHSVLTLMNLFVHPTVGKGMAAAVTAFHEYFYPKDICDAAASKTQCPSKGHFKIPP